MKRRPAASPRQQNKKIFKKPSNCQLWHAADTESEHIRAIVLHTRRGRYCNNSLTLTARQPCWCAEKQALISAHNLCSSHTQSLIRTPSKVLCDNANNHLPQILMSDWWFVFFYRGERERIDQVCGRMMNWCCTKNQEAISKQHIFIRFIRWDIRFCGRARASCFIDPDMQWFWALIKSTERDTTLTECIVWSECTLIINVEKVPS
jgi:hypothetical protein